MAYLPNFEEDVFISYAHYDDDGPFSTEPRRWVAQLHFDLEQRVKVHLGAKASLWRDCEIKNNEDFEKRILSRLVRTATLLSIISPSFFEREWCLRELAEFSAHMKTFGGRVDDQKRRIFKVEKVDVGARALPLLLRGSGSYKFYGPDPQSGKVHEFRPMLSSEYGKRYFEQMDELARDIASVLQGLGQKSPQPQAQSRSVYLAEPTPDLIEEATDIRRELKGWGYTVLPPDDLPNQATEFRAAVQGYLRRSAVSVHLIGNDYGAVPEGEAEKSRVWLQHDLARQRASEGDLARFIWLATPIHPADARQKTFIRRLLDDPAGVDIRRDTLEQFKSDLLQEIQQKPPEAEAPGPLELPTKRSGDELVRVYVICDQSDYDSSTLTELRKCLFDRGYEPILPSPNNGEKEALQEHDDNLAICDAVLIYYGSGSERWFNTKLMDLRKVLSRRARPVLARGIYIAPPDTPSKIGLQTHEASVLRGTTPFSPEALKPFLNLLAAGSE